MATNNDAPGTLPPLPPLLGRGLETLMAMPVTVVIAVVLAFFALQSLGPRVDPREPPLLKPRIPFIGHIIGMITQQAQYHTTLQRRTRKPIATLPMLNGKMYAVWDPYLIAAGLKSKALSTTPHIIQATPAVAQTSPATTTLLRGAQGPHIVDRVMLHAIPTSFKGQSMQRLNQTALAELAASLTTLAPSSTTPTPIPNAWLWLRHLLTSATTTSLYGAAHNPFVADPALHVEPALWTLEKNLLKLTLNLPSFLAPAGHRARSVLFDALTPYYQARRDTDPAASDFVRNRAAELRAGGLPDDDLARVEIMLPFAALANTVPLLFWFFCFVFSRPALVARLREEAEGLVAGRREDGEVTLVMTGPVVEERCPLLMSCYRETQRKTVHQISTRTVMEDTVLSDQAGRGYVLKKGNVVQLAIGAAHEMEEYWGEDFGEFKPARFLGRKGEAGDGPGSAKAMRMAFSPFGGGSHLCPGRHFAFAEMMAVMATLLLGYEIEALDGIEWNMPAFATPSVIDAVTKPAKHGEGFGVRIKRRQGWEGVRWRYEL